MWIISCDSFLIKNCWKVKFVGFVNSAEKWMKSQILRLLFTLFYCSYPLVHHSWDCSCPMNSAPGTSLKKKKKEKTRKTWKCWIQTALMYRLITWKFIHMVDLGFISVQGLDWRLCYKFVISYLWVSEFCIEEFGWTIDVVLMYLLSIPKYWNIFSCQFAMLMDMLICKIFIFVSCIMNHSLTWLTWLMWC